MIEVKPLTEETQSDAQKVISARFPTSALVVLDKVLRNPARRICSEVGDIAYDDGRPVGLQALIGKKIYLGRCSSYANVGGLTVLLEDAPVEAMIDIKAASLKNRLKNLIGFGNTLCAATEKMARKAKDSFGPESSCWYRYRPVRWFDFGWYCFSRKVLKRPIPNWAKFDSLSVKPFRWRFGDFVVERVLSFDSRFDEFWSRYVESNEGLVCSRTVEELEWIFGDEIRNGRAVVLGLLEKGQLNGYLVLKDEGESGRRWQVMDWVALGNDAKRLNALLAAGCRFLKSRTPAMLVESIGFPTFIQEVIKKHLPFMRYAGNNFFSYGYRKPKTEGKEFAEKCEAVINTPKSWFFGPYDGDMCM